MRKRKYLFYVVILCLLFVVTNIIGSYSPMIYVYAAKSTKEDKDKSTGITDKREKTESNKTIEKTGFDQKTKDYLSWIVYKNKENDYYLEANDFYISFTDGSDYTFENCIELLYQPGGMVSIFNGDTILRDAAKNVNISTDFGLSINLDSLKEVLSETELGSSLVDKMADLLFVINHNHYRLYSESLTILSDDSEWTFSEYFDFVFKSYDMVTIIGSNSISQDITTDAYVLIDQEISINFKTLFVLLQEIDFKWYDTEIADNKSSSIKKESDKTIDAVQYLGDDHFGKIIDKDGNTWNYRFYADSEEVRIESVSLNSEVVNVNIPKEIEDSPVVEIGESIFMGNKKIKTVIIPDSVTSIGASAFSNCTNLIYVKLPESLKVVGKKAFEGCKSLTDLTIPGSVKKIGKNAFNKSNGPKEIILAEGYKKIGSGSTKYLSAYTNLKMILIPESVTTIEDGIFEKLENLSVIYYGGTEEEWKKLSMNAGISKKCVVVFDYKGNIRQKGEKGEKGDKGDKGDKGEKGEKGEKGDKGETGRSGLNGYDGYDGRDGLSAYEIAVKNGFTGTETEWLASLKGEKGDKGADGVNGTNGINGTNGTNGTNGLNGKSALDVAREETNNPNLTYDGWIASIAMIAASLSGGNGSESSIAVTPLGENGDQGINIILGNGYVLSITSDGMSLIDNKGTETDEDDVQIVYIAPSNTGVSQGN